MMAWTFMSVYFVMALLLSLGGAIFVFMVALNKRLAIDVLFFLGVATAGAVSYYFSQRDLSLRDVALDVTSETWVARFANIAALAACLVALIQTATNGPVSRNAVIIAAATLQYYFICFLFPASFDRWFIFDHRLLYPIAGLLIVLMPMMQTTEKLATNFARVTVVPAALSLLLIVVNYKAAVLDNYQSLLPFFKGRLYGASPHPNVLGSMAVFGILLCTAYPPKSRRELWAIISINGLALLLSQSKTSWLTLIICLSIIHFPRIRRFRGEVPAWVLVSVFMALAALLPAASLLDKSIYNYWAGNQTIGQIGTLTGRTDIWRPTLFLISQHLVMGPGLGTFEVYMHSLYPTLVANPHNLFLSTMVRAGLIGLASFAVFIATLVILAARLHGRDRLFALAYIVLICVRGMSESFTLESAFMAPVFWTLLMFMRFLAVAGAEPRQSVEDKPLPFQLAAR